MLLDIDKINHPKTRKYFSEIDSSYANGNYRSAVLVLYSVVVADILFKLKTLEEDYDDDKAKSIIRIIEDSKANNSKKENWENKLLECSKEFLNQYMYEKYSELKKIRNLSAHPIFNEDYELIIPSKETVAGLIVDMYNGLFIQPPLFLSKGQNIAEKICKELIANKKIYNSNDNLLSTFLNIRYFSHMSVSIKCMVFKCFWYYSFINTSDDECIINRTLFHKTLHYLYVTEKNEILDFMNKNKSKFKFSDDNAITHWGSTNTDSSIYRFSVFLSLNRECFTVLDKDIQTNYEILAERNPDTKLLNKLIHTDFANGDEYDEFKMQFNRSITYVNITITTAMERISDCGKLYDFTNLLIDYFGGSLSYLDSSIRYHSIESIIPNMDETQLNNVIDKINNNSQLYENFDIKKWISDIRINPHYSDIEENKTLYPNFFKNI